MQLSKSVMKKLAILIAGGIVLNWVLNNLTLAGNALGFLWGLIFPFILGLIIAFILNNPMRFIERVVFRGKGGRFKRPVSMVLAILLVLAVIAFVIFLVAPQLAAAVSAFFDAMPGYIERMQESLAPYAKYVPQLETFLQNLNLDWNKISQNIIGLVRSGAGSLLGSAVDVASSIVSGIISFSIGLFFACYVLFDKEHLIHQTKGLMLAYIPEQKCNKIFSVLHLANVTFSGFISGQCMEAIALTVVYFIVMLIGRFQYALLISVLIGFFSFIPMIGAIVGCVLGALLLLFASGFWRALAFVIIFLLVQQFDGNVMYPRIVGSSVGLPPLWVLVAVTIGGSLMGIAGMLLFLPLTSVVHALLRQNALNRLVKKGLATPEALAAAAPPQQQRRFRDIFKRKPKKKK